MSKRLDKYLCDKNIGTRSQVKALIQKGQVTINDEVIKKPETKVSDSDIVCCQGRVLSNEGLGRSLGRGRGNPFQYSCLENPMDRGARQATVHGVAKSWTRLK